MTIKVLHVYKTYYPDPPGGLQEAIRQIAASTMTHDIQTNIYVLSPNPVPVEIDRPEALVIREKSWIAPVSCDLGGIGSVRKFMELTRKVDLIHYHYPWPFADLLHLGSCTSVPAVMTYHSDIVRQKLLDLIYHPLRSRMMAQMKAIVATSPSYAQSSPILSNQDIASRVRVIPLAIDESTYPIQGDPAIFDRLVINENEPFFLFVGVLRYYKGLHFLLKASTAVNAKIIIAGEGPEAENLKKLKDQLNAGNVIFTGRISDREKISLLKRCRAFVLPSHLRSEAYGMVLVEAAMLGRPMVSCEIGTGTSFVNSDQETGFVVPPENPSALAAALNSLLADEVLAERLGRSARERYEKLFSGPALGRAYAGLYREVLGEYN
jgi:glycosyltransferase involved in cell wall biosynthesis